MTRVAINCLDPDAAKTPPVREMPGVPRIGDRVLFNGVRWLVQRVVWVIDREYKGGAVDYDAMITVLAD